MKGAYIRIPAITLAIFATFKYVDERTFITCLILWLGYASLCLGLLNAQQIKNIKLTKKFKNV